MLPLFACLALAQFPRRDPGAFVFLAQARHVLCSAFGLGLGWYLAHHTDSPVPYLDALLTSGSLVAQWMMTRKLLENWAIWIALDIVYVPTFIARGLPITAVQYAVFLVLALMGWFSWKRSWAVERFRGAPA